MKRFEITRRVLYCGTLAGLLCGCEKDEPLSAAHGAGATSVGARGGAGAGSGGEAASGGSGGGGSGGSASLGGSSGSGGLLSSTGGGLGAPVRVPCGIYVNGGIRAASFVTGMFVTPKWAELEIAPGAYDFSAPFRNARQLPAGQRLSIRMTGAEPASVVENARETWVWIDPNPAHEDSDCAGPEGCARPVPWDEPSLTRYADMVHGMAETIVDIGGVEARLAEHPALESVMLTLPGWGRIREIGFEIESLPGYTRAALIDATLRALRIQAENFPGKSVLTQFFPIDDGASPVLWEALRDAILADSSLDAVGFYQENLAHSILGGEETFRPAQTTVAAPLYTSRDQTFIGFQTLTSWAAPSESYEDAVAGGSPPAAIAWALETYGSRYYEIYAQDVDAATEGDHPEWLAPFEEISAELCED